MSVRIDRRRRFDRLQTIFMETFGLGRAVSLFAILFAGIVIVLAVFWFFYSAPPDTLTITSGPEESAFRRNADRYREILLRNGVKLKILSSQGSRQNLERLADPRVSCRHRVRSGRSGQRGQDR